MAKIGKALTKTRTNLLVYLAFGALLVGLFVAGVKIGSAMVTPAAPQSAPDQQPDKLSAPGGALVNPPYLLKDFTLTSHEDKPISLSDLRGKPVVLTFGYTHCATECPATLANYKLLKQQLGAEAENVTFVFVSVDGKRDTPEVLKTYLAQFDPAFIGMTGSEAALRALGQQYGLLFELQTGQSQARNAGEAAHDHSTHDHAADEKQQLDPENYFVQHSSPSYFIDADGYLRMVYFFGATPDAMAQGLRQLLND